MELAYWLCLNFCNWKVHRYCAVILFTDKYSVRTAFWRNVDNDASSVLTSIVQRACNHVRCCESLHFVTFNWFSRPSLALLHLLMCVLVLQSVDPCVGIY
jgi:hypothetical protein